ncbi:unnamed protein product [Cylicocyclus nassatus]|uniref:Uncharacterized protein n=1 Tax=Cylicocyclus nassatus TaxID=53992 RepID=A0AA36H8Z1_CYLNA|nr:unnamed protein product [Cylicocyclus nassatus]
MRLLLIIVFIVGLKSKYLSVYSCIATTSPEERVAVATPRTVQTVPRTLLRARAPPAAPVVAPVRVAPAGPYTPAAPVTPATTEEPAVPSTTAESNLPVEIIVSIPGPAQTQPVVPSPGAPTVLRYARALPAVPAVAIVPVVTATTAVDFTTTTTFSTDCTTACPSVYSNECDGYGVVCADATEALAAVISTGTECQQTWVCPPGTSAYYYTSFSSQATFYPADYALCSLMRGGYWTFPDGYTIVAALSCQDRGSQIPASN